MVYRFLALILGLVCCSRAGAATDAAKRPQQPMVLWYRQPAAEWIEALPLGNGRLAAMVFGGVEQEHLQLNEEGLWSGGPRDTNNPDALKYLPQVRKLLFEGKHAEAEALAGAHLIGRPARVFPYQSLGDLTLDIANPGEATHYRRELDLDTAVARVSYWSEGARFTREAFISAPDQVLVMRLTCNKPGSINATIGITREQDARSFTEGNQLVILDGQADEGKGVKFRAHVLAVPDGGAVEAKDGKLVVSSADSLTVLLAAATSYRDGDPADICRRRLAKANKPFDRLLKTHVKEHQAMFHRVTLDLGRSSSENLPTDERLAAVEKGGEDPGLVALYFQFGRYLLMASSRPGGLPANLQGKWVEGMRPAWNADYHTNINVQMNYWPAEVCNLPECVEPLVDLIDSLREPGRKTARIHYGCDGWVVHHLTDAWGFTTPADGVWGIWPMGGAWLCRHLWEHYAYSHDREFLAKRAYPIMKESAEFLLDFLVEDEKGRLVTNPSHSPENRFRPPEGGLATLCVGATMDLQIIHDLFTNCIQAARILDTDYKFRARLKDTLSRIPPLQVGKRGQLQEWLEYYDDWSSGHRHVSHLYGVYPGRQITLRDTPRLAKAARVSLDRRLANGGGNTGWSRAWTINLMARFEDEEQAYESVMEMLRGYTAKNLFDLVFDHRQPFQIDGNLGATAGIAEMLLQSHLDHLSLLPALPKAWPNGFVTGLRARGGCEVDMEWAGGKLVSATVRAKLDGPIRMRLHEGTVLRPEKKDLTLRQVADGIVEFDAQRGQEYRFAAASIK